MNMEQIKRGGEIGRRIDITVDNNMLAVDIEHDFKIPVPDDRMVGADELFNFKDGRCTHLFTVQGACPEDPVYSGCVFEIMSGKERKKGGGRFRYG